jgi:tetratricopeptide (TPR) repeat protein
MLALALVALGHPAPVGAQSGDAGPNAASANGGVNVQKARRHFLMGKQAFEEKRYPTAFQEFESGYAIDPRAGFLLDMGHAARRMGEAGRALALYQRFLATDPPEGERRVAVKLIADLRRELPAAPEPAASLAAAGSSAATSSSPLPPAPEPATTAAPVVLSLVDVASSTEGDSHHIERADAPPIYRRWWFWAGAGGLAAGVASAIVIGALASGASAHDSGSWGQLRL